jgi:hypothetical protein
MFYPVILSFQTPKSPKTSNIFHFYFNRITSFKANRLYLFVFIKISKWYPLSSTGMVEMGGMNPRTSQMEMQQRMMMRQQLRGQSMQQQQQQQMSSGMLRPPGPEYPKQAEMMSGAQQMMGQNPNQAAMMTRFNPTSSGPGRPTQMTTPPQQMAPSHRLPQQQQQQQPQPHGNMYQSVQHRMVQPNCGQPGPGPGGPMGNMNMNPHMRRMSSHHPNNVQPGNPGMGPGHGAMGMNGGPMMNPAAQSQQPGMGNVNMQSQEWMAMQQQQQDPGVNRNFSNMQQGHRTNQNPSGFHPGKFKRATNNKLECEYRFYDL